MGFANSTFGSKNRTSVLYDFSIVKKAAFYVFHKTTDGAKNMYKLHTGKEIYGGGTGILYAQINPYELKLDCGKKKRRQKSSLQPNTRLDNRVEPEYYKTLSMELIYDVYDEHMVGTLDGMLTGLNNIDLTEKNLTSLPALVELSRDPTQVVFFKWGAFKFFGRVDSVDFTYKAFSRFGFPLKAVGNVTLMSEGDELKGDGSIQSAEENPKLSTVTGVVKAMEKTDDIALYAEIGATEALR